MLDIQAVLTLDDALISTYSRFDPSPMKSVSLYLLSFEITSWGVRALPFGEEIH
jgi:hypothetical protein